LNKKLNLLGFIIFVEIKFTKIVCIIIIIVIAFTNSLFLISIFSKQKISIKTFKLINKKIIDVKYRYNFYY
jgi:hypothetical protein